MKKKTAGIVLTIAVVLFLIGLAVLGILKTTSQKLQTGNLADIEWYDENGTEFTITTAQQLYDVATLSDFYTFEGQTIKLGADIVVNEGNAKDWAESQPANRWYPISNFAGTFDGQGHTISGIYGKSVDAPMALFSLSKPNCVIQDFKLINSYFGATGSGGTASIASNGGGTFKRIYSDAIISVQGGYAAGFMSTVTAKTAVSECWFDGSVLTTDQVGGGFMDSSVMSAVTLEHCLFSGTYETAFDMGGAKAGGLCGFLEGRDANLYITDSLSAGEMQSGNRYYMGSVLGLGRGGSYLEIENVYGSMDSYEQWIGRNGSQGTVKGSAIEIRGMDLTGVSAYQRTALDFDKYWAVVEEDTPILKCFAKESPSLDGVKRAYNTDWYKENATEYTIYTAEELYGFAILSSTNDFKGKTVKLGADIVINEGKAENYTKEAPDKFWYPIKAFAGTFDGQGHTISGIYMSYAKEANGLFAETTSDSTVRNLKVTNSYLENTSELSAVMGTVAGRGGGTFENIYVDTILSSTGQIVGGVIGQINAESDNKVSNCWFDGEVHLKENTGRYGGGIVGTIVKGKDIVEHCLNTGTITCEAVQIGLHVGGLVGAVMNYGTRLTMDDCMNSGVVKADYGVCIGAIFGRIMVDSEVTIANTYATTECYQTTRSDFLAIGDNSVATKSGGVVDFSKSVLDGIGAYQWTTLDFDNYWAAQKNDTPILKQFASSSLSTVGAKKKFSVAWYQEDATTYTLNTKEDLYGFYLVSKGTNFAEKTVNLGADIQVNAGSAAEWATNAPENSWYPVNKFAGTFDGQGHTISGIYMSVDAGYAGLFSRTADGSVIKNLRLTNSYFTSTASLAALGSIVGEFSGTLDTVYSDAIVESGGTQVGGLIGRVNSSESSFRAVYKVTNCWFDGKAISESRVAANAYLGGVVGAMIQGTLNMDNCLNTGTVTYMYDEVPLLEDGSPWYLAVYAGGLVGGVMNGRQYDANGTLTRISECNISDSMGAGLVVSGLKDGSKDANGAGSIFGYTSAGTVNMKNLYAIAGKGVRTVHYGANATVTGAAAVFGESTLLGINGYRYTTLDFQKYWAAREDMIPALAKFVASGTQLSLAGEWRLDTNWYDKSKDSFTISTIGQLYGFAYLANSGNSFSGKTVKLGADMTLNSGNAADWAEAAPKSEWTPILNFAGTFDGDMHTISGLYVASTGNYVGLFGSTTATSAVKNLRLKNSYIKSTVHAYPQVGSVAGLANGTFTAIYSDAIVSCEGDFSGGLFGRVNDTCKVTNCWFDGSLTTQKMNAGGILGHDEGTVTMENCIFTGTVTSTDTVGSGGAVWIGGFIGQIPGGKSAVLKNCISAGKVRAQLGNAVGSVIGRTRGALEVERVYTTDDVVNEKGAVGKESAFSGTGNYSVQPQGKIAIVSDVSGAQARYNMALDFYTAENHAGVWVARREKAPGLKIFVEEKEWYTEDEKITPDTSWYYNNTTATEYTISTAAELYGLSQILRDTNGFNFSQRTIKLGADITVNVGDSGTWATLPPVNNDWIPIGDSTRMFNAKYFDGQDYAIRGIYAKTNTLRTGLFGYTTTNVTIQNLRLENSYFETTYKGDENSYAAIGSIVGQHQGSIHNVYSSAIVVSAGNDCGGLIGRLSESNVHQISNCWFDGRVETSGNYCGGIVGDIVFGAKIENCLNTGIVQSTEKYPHGGLIAITGGMFGYIQGNAGAVTISNCLNAGTVKGSNGDSTGSVIGRVRKEITITNTYTTDDVVMAEGETLIVTAPGIGRYSIASKGEPQIVEKTAITGESAKDTLNGFNFDSVWAVRENDVPGLQGFVDAEVKAGVRISIFQMLSRILNGANQFLQ